MKDIRADFPLLKRNADIVYFDNASTTQKPQQVLDALMRVYAEHYANTGRAIYSLAEQATEHYESARAQIAQWINASTKETIFVRGATEGINAIATGWALNNLKAGDEIVLTELEHHANLVPWQRVAQLTGASLRFIPIMSNGELDMAAAEKMIHKKTRLVATTHISNAIGTRVDIDTITALAKHVGAKVLIDACQSAPHERVDVKKIGCDFLTFSGHKMLGPTGSGVLYISESVQDEVQPFCLGGGSVRNVRWDFYELASAPHKFEAGTVSLAQAVGLSEAIRYLKTYVPFDALRAHTAQLSSFLINELLKMPGVTVYGPLSHLKDDGFIVTFAVKKYHAHDIAAFLNTHGICVRAGNFCAQPLAHKLGYDAAIRVSFYCYNSLNDVVKLVDVMKQIL